MKGIAYILELEKWSVYDLAKEIGVSPSVLYRWLNGKKAIPHNRVEQLSRMFPIYPSQYIEAELSESDKVFLRNRKYEDEVASKEAESPLLDMKRGIKAQVLEQQKVFDDIKTILNVESIDDMDDEDKVSKNVLLAILSAVSEEQSKLTYDYKTLNKLEKMRVNSVQQGKRSSALLLISVTLAALCRAFDIEDSIEDLVYTPSFNVNFQHNDESDALLKSHIDTIKERRDNLESLFRSIIDDCNMNEAAMAALMQLENEKKGTERDGNPEKS
jgi:transcriptional regulator with XRE-family HTH domain